jgi:hypothetical protein
MALPIYKSDDNDLMLMQTAWAKQINPIISSPLNQGVLLKQISLIAGDNTIDHRLGRDLQGWQIVRLRASAIIYDKQDSNQLQNRTLILNSSAPVIVDLYVF